MGSSIVKAIALGRHRPLGPLVLACGTHRWLSDRDEPAETKEGRGRLSTLSGVTIPANLLGADLRIITADFDNNGAIDLLASSAATAQAPVLWLQGDDRKFQRLPKNLEAGSSLATADLAGHGRLDLLAVSSTGDAIGALNQGTRNYHWQTIRPRARQTTGDQRVNSFGIGGEIEIRSGLLPQKQTISSPELHFGLGEQTGADVARIVWPNGSVRAEFALKADQPILTEQRLKGSCPFLFA